MDTESVTGGSTPRRYWHLPVFLLGVAAAIAAYVQFPPPVEDPAATVRRTADELRIALGKSLVSVPRVESLTAELESAAGAVPGSNAEVAFLAGSGHVAMAEHGPADAAVGHWKAADKLFAPLDPISLTAPQDGAKLAVRRAKVHAALGTGDPAEIVRVLSTPMPDEDLSEKSRYIAEACLRMSPPDYSRAKAELAAYLGGPITLAPAETARYRLRLGELCSRDGQYAEAKSYLLKACEPSVAADVRAAAQVVLARNALAEDHATEAEKLFAEAIRSDALPKDQRDLVRFQAAEVMAKLNHTVDAVAGYKVVAAAKGPVGVAAKVRLAEQLTRTGQRAEAAQFLTQAVGNVTKTSPFQNPYLRVEQVQAAFEELIAVGLKAGDDDTALNAATAYQAVAVPDRGRERRAQVYLARAGRLIPLAAGNPQVRTAAETAYRDAAREFDALATLLPTAAGKADAMAKAAAALKAVGDYPAARAKLDAVATLPGLSKHAVASACLDAADVATLAADPVAAKSYLQKAIDNGGPAGYLARVKLSAAMRADVAAVQANPSASPDAKAKAEADSLFAIQLLEQVADAANVTEAEKPAHEKALFDLGWAMLKQARTTEAEARFRKLLQLYPNTKDLGTARLCLASALLAQVEKAGNPADPRLGEAMQLLDSVAMGADKSLQIQAKLRVARAYLGVGKYEQAVTAATALADAAKGTCDELVALSMVYLGYAKQELWTQAAVIESRMRTTYRDLPDSAFAGGPPEYTRQFWTTNWFDYLDKSRSRKPNDVRTTGGTAPLKK
ncbi:MAG TPA: tetratricopeptide repeat protein [Fimbriiglobus sp.]|jgi:tetratricopeptide (TPR) repeat protein